MQPDEQSIMRAAASLGVVMVKPKSHRPTFTPGQTKRDAYLAKWDRAGPVIGTVPVPHREQFARDATKEAFRGKA